MINAEQIGQISSYLALAFGLLFFVFACKYYLAILLALFGGKTSKVDINNYRNRLFRQPDREEPFISIQLPFYNEKNVAKRIIDACSKLEYSNYEVIIADDSRDETINILQDISRRQGKPKIKIVHRNDRAGFKGGALQKAMEYMDPRTKYVVVFDADFLPPPDILQRFLWYFEGESSGNSKTAEENGHRFGGQVLEHYKNGDSDIYGQVDSWYRRKKVGVVQGYQLHHLNKNENWITKGIRAEFSGGYMIERTAEEYFGAMKMITGSVFMIRADVLSKLGWTHSITEDWDLTLRMYMDGYKVLYTPLIQAPAEIPTTIRALTRQRMRWAEGHTYAVKKHFWGVLGSKNISFREKLEFLYFAPYYLQSFFFMIGTMFWFLAEMLNQHPDFWTSTFGWSLILSNMFALPLMSLSGLYLEQTARADFSGIFSFIVLSYVLTPFQAYAAIKGLLEKDEGGWVRTLKTGSITDRVLQIQLRKLFSWILPKSEGKNRKEKANPKDGWKVTLAVLVLMSSIIVWVSASALGIQDYGAVSTALTLESLPSFVTVNNIETKNILTHPDYTNLGTVLSTPYTVEGNGWETAWSFILYGPLEEEYTMNMPVDVILYISSSEETDTGIWVSLYELKSRGNTNLETSKKVEFEVDIDSEDPVTIRMPVRHSSRFDEGSSILVKIKLKDIEHERDEAKVTYYLEYGSKLKQSRLEFPGMVMPEFLVPAVILAVIYGFRRTVFD